MGGKEKEAMFKFGIQPGILAMVIFHAGEILEYKQETPNHLSCLKFFPNEHAH
jgi:hypothetical protein